MGEDGDRLQGYESRVEADGSVTAVLHRAGKPDVLIHATDLVNIIDEPLPDGRLRQTVEVIGPDGVDTAVFVVGDGQR